MAKILFSLSGEGRGHATRVRAVVERLREKHEIVVLAPGDAFDFLDPLYRDGDVRVIPIPGLRFFYNERRQLAFGRTAAAAARYLSSFPQLLAQVGRLLREENPDLAVTDFEPSLPRAARRCGIPFISLSHQHFLLAYDLSSLPLWLRLHCVYMGRVVRAYYSGERHSIISSFFFPPLRKGCRRVTQVGVMLRPALRETVSTAGEHLVAYLRRFGGRNVLDALASAGRPVRIYGFGERATEGRLSFHAIDENRFIEDLAACAGLVATAGNQLVGEALYLGKPCFLMPESRNFEQFVNAHFLAQTGAGTWKELEKTSAADVIGFVKRLEEFRARIDARKLDGLQAAVRALQRFVPGARAPGRATARAFATRQTA